MKTFLSRLAAFAGRHWLRLGLIGCAVFLLSQKQIDFHLNLGHPAVLPLPGEQSSPTPETAGSDRGGILSRFDFFGGQEAGLYDRLAGQHDTEVRAFIDRFAHVAQAEQEKFGIPASITLAVGLLYSGAGTAAGVRDYRNYFGLGCTDGWQGHTGRVAGDCVRSYETAWLSFRDFSTYVTSGKFARMRQFGPRDHRMWAAGLQELGLNGNDELAGDLGRVIERYGLAQFD